MRSALPQSTRGPSGAGAGRRCLMLASAGAVVASGLLTLAPAFLAPASATTGALTGCVEVIRTSDSVSLGHMSDGGWAAAVTSDPAQAAHVSVQPGSQREVTFVGDTSETPYLGATAGFSGNTLGPGSPAYLWLTRTGHTDSGATPQPVANSAGYGDSESSIWSLDGVTGALTMDWVNPSGDTAPATNLIYNISVGALYGVGDASAFGATYGEQYAPVRLALDSDCGVAAETTTTGTPSATTVEIGTPVTDTAAVTGDGSPTGTVSFSVCGPLQSADGCAADGTAVGAAVTLTDGSATSESFTPETPGTYCFRADYSGDDANAASSDGTDGQCFTATTIAQTITFALPTTATVADTEALTGTGGDSGNPVTYAVDDDSAAVCSIDEGTLSFDAGGDCVVRADQAGNASYADAPQVAQTVEVAKAATDTALSFAPATPVHGESSTATATVTTEVGTVSGAVQFEVDGDEVGAPVTVNGSGTATSPALGSLSAGDHTVTATFTPSDDQVHEGSDATQTLSVGKGTTGTTVTVAPSTVSATVAPVAPGAGAPSGTVTFSVGGTPVGTAPVTGGTATLTYSVPSGQTQQVAAVYSGDDDFLGSSDSTSRQDPAITASVTSATAKSAGGWYRGPVTVTFTCTPNSAPLAGPCPAPVTLTGDGAGQSVTRSVLATDGGAATVSVTGIAIDGTVPTVAVEGVSDMEPYFVKGPKATCTGADVLSGLASCTIAKTKHGSEITYVATATDLAGNTATASRTVRVDHFVVRGATFADGRYTVTAGQGYTLLVGALGQPRYGDQLFEKVGKHRWALGVTFPKKAAAKDSVKVTVRIGGRVLSVSVHVVR
jgi:hypothetical protein